MTDAPSNILPLGSPNAASIREALAAAGVYAVNLAGPVGCGKTALLECTIRRLSDHVRTGLVVSNVMTPAECRVLEPYGCQVIHIDAASLDAGGVFYALDAKLDLGRIDLLLMEIPVGLDHPEVQDLGEDARVAVFAANGADRQLAPCSSLIASASLVLMTKADLTPHWEPGRKRFESEVHRFNPSAGILRVSTVSGAGINDWLYWLGERRLANRPTDGQGAGADLSSDWFFG